MHDAGEAEDCLIPPMEYMLGHALEQEIAKGPVAGQTGRKYSIKWSRPWSMRMLAASCTATSELMHDVVDAMRLALVLLSSRGATLSPEHAAASAPGNGMEGHMASRGGAACLAEPHHGCSNLGHNFCLPRSVIFLFVVPWDCVWRNFIAARGER